MKRVYKSPATPERLRSYVKAFPDETWEHFRRRNRRGYREVKQQLLQDQHGLCAYCEISIKLAEFEDNVDDFRVEHFFPKVATQLEKHNYHLDWHNLLGVCHGGSQPYVSDPEWRYSSRRMTGAVMYQRAGNRFPSGTEPTEDTGVSQAVSLSGAYR